MYDALLERLHKRIALTTAGSPLQDDLREAADAIEELSKHRWIPATERLPELNANVLVYSTHSGLIRIDANIWFDRNATHWMPLPQPPKDE